MRAIVKNAMKVGELAHQFECDAVDWEQVDMFIPDTYILKEAKWKLYNANEAMYDLDADEPDYKIWKKDARQLERFINKWEDKCEPHENDGLAWEELSDKINKYLDDWITKDEEQSNGA